MELGMQQHGSKYFAQPPPPTTLGNEVNMSKLIVVFKGNHEHSDIVSNIQISIGQSHLFSEHGHVAYQIKRNHAKCSNMVEILQVSLFLLNYSMKTS